MEELFHLKLPLLSFMRGFWAAKLTGNYSNPKRKKRVLCPCCCRRFGNEGNLAVHLSSKHPWFASNLKTRPITDFTTTPAKKLHPVPIISKNTPLARKHPKNAPITEPPAKKQSIPATPAKKSQIKREFRISCDAGKKERILEAYSKLETAAEKQKFKEVNRVTTDQLKNWRRPSRRKITKENASRRSTKCFYMSAASRMKKRVGYFAAQEAILFKNLNFDEFKDSP